MEINHLSPFTLNSDKTKCLRKSGPSSESLFLLTVVWPCSVLSCHWNHQHLTLENTIKFKIAVLFWKNWYLKKVKLEKRHIRNKKKSIYIIKRNNLLDLEDLEVTAAWEYKLDRFNQQKVTRENFKRGAFTINIKVISDIMDVWNDFSWKINSNRLSSIIIK